MPTLNWIGKEAVARRPGDRSIPGGNLFTGPVFVVLPKFAGAKVIHAAANRLSGRAAHECSNFKQLCCALQVQR